VRLRSFELLFQLSPQLNFTIMNYLVSNLQTVLPITLTIIVVLVAGGMLLHRADPSLKQYSVEAMKNFSMLLGAAAIFNTFMGINLIFFSKIDGRFIFLTLTTLSFYLSLMLLMYTVSFVANPTPDPETAGNLAGS
jgi:hypothetical protein